VNKINSNKDTTPLISFCIPTYMREKKLTRCLDSVIAQKTFNNGDVEVFISNDSSTDNTEEIIRKYKNNFSCIRSIRNKINIGYDLNIISLLTGFRGNYIFILSDDDILLPGALETLREKITNNPKVSVFFSGYELYEEKNRKTTVHQTFMKEEENLNWNMQEIALAFQDSHDLSRLCIKKNFIDLKNLSKYIGSLYIHMYIIGYAALKGIPYYINTPLIRCYYGCHEVYWGVYPNDYMLRRLIKMIKDLSLINKNFYAPAMKLLIESVPHMMANSINQNKEKFFKLLIELLKIPEIRLNPTIWRYGLFFMFSKLKFKIIK
jgi:glycosyltransferase involved in cell wall biosynthesis